jgi:hypothetical protein
MPTRNLSFGEFDFLMVETHDRASLRTAHSIYFKFTLTFTLADLNLPFSNPATASTFSNKNKLLIP